MSFFNPFFRATELKIVLTGAVGSGRSTFLAQLRAHHRDALSDRRSSPPNGTPSREHHFFLPLAHDVGTKVRCSVYAQLGNGEGLEARAELRWLLKGVDGVLFVADAQRVKESSASIARLRALLAEGHMALEDLALVLVANKQDLGSAIASADLRAAVGLPSAHTVETIASEGSRVDEAFRALTQMMSNRHRERLDSQRKLVTAT